MLKFRNTRSGPRRGTSYSKAGVLPKEESDEIRHTDMSESGTGHWGELRWASFFVTHSTILWGRAQELGL